MNLENWFNSLGLDVHYHKNNEFVFYKGFKITRASQTYKIEDTRFNDFYSEVKLRDKKILTEHGFIKGCDILNYNRDKRRLRYYINQIKRLKQSIKKRKRRLHLNREFNEKRIRNHTDSIKEYENLKGLCEIRIYNFKNKYK